MTVGWKPEQEAPDGLVQENLFTSTQVTDGGQRLPIYWPYRYFNESFRPGTARHEVVSSDPLILGLASTEHTVLINQYPAVVEITLDGVAQTLQPYQVARFDADGAMVDSSYDSVEG